MRSVVWWTAYIYAMRKPTRNGNGEYTDAVPLPDPRMWLDERLTVTLNGLISMHHGEAFKISQARSVYALRKPTKLCRNHYIRRRFRDEWKTNR